MKENHILARRRVHLGRWILSWLMNCMYAFWGRSYICLISTCRLPKLPLSILCKAALTHPCPFSLLEKLDERETLLTLLLAPLASALQALSADVSANMV